MAQLFTITCPVCHQAMQSSTSIFAERGEWDGKQYAFEGVLDTYICICGCEIAIIAIPETETSPAPTPRMD